LVNKQRSKEKGKKEKKKKSNKSWEKDQQAQPQKIQLNECTFIGIPRRTKKSEGRKEGRKEGEGLANGEWRVAKTSRLVG